MTKYWVIGIAGLVLAVRGFAASSIYVQDMGDARFASKKTKAVQKRPAPTTVSKVYSVHVVKKSETLLSISRRYRVSIQALQAANRLKTTRLKIGQRLKIPSAFQLKPPSKLPSKPRPQKASLGAYPVSNPPAPRPVPAPPVSARQAPSYLFINSIKSALDAPAIRPGRWRNIVIHHSGTSGGNARIFEYFHRNVRGMENGMAYHFVIGNGQDSGDGQIEIGNRWVRQIKGGHVKGEALNEVSLGICFVGDFSKSPPTKRQIAAAIELVSYLRDKCGKPYPQLETHTEINPNHTQCPGKYFPTRSFHQLFE